MRCCIAALLVASGAGLSGCEDQESRTAPMVATVTSSAGTAATSSASASASVAPQPSPCPADMALVEGSYCPWVRHRCLEKQTGGYEHCLRYGEPRCMSKKRVPMRFCMDRYEWPNQEGTKPLTLVSWPRARKLCEARGKRLCTVEEFNFACEGESMKPHVHGFERDGEICHYDQPYIQRTYSYERYDDCMKVEACKREYQRLDQRLPAGSKPKCVSDHGVYDLNGNANEWVFRTRQKSPDRSGLKGGWWGPVRNRCRPITVAHREGDYGYEAGFRCCADVKDDAKK